MGGTCANCRKKIGFMASSDTCSHPDCDAQECEDCDGKVLQECEKCGDIYCIKHINAHPCEEEDKEEDNSEDEEGEFVAYSEKDTWAFVNQTDADTWTDVCNALEGLERKGYEFIATMNDGILMRKK